MCIKGQDNISKISIVSNSTTVANMGKRTELKHTGENIIWVCHFKCILLTSLLL